MDVNWARSLFTVLVFICFMLVLYIVMNKRNKSNYDEVSRSIIEDDDTAHDDNDNNSAALISDTLNDFCLFSINLLLN